MTLLAVLIILLLICGFGGTPRFGPYYGWGGGAGIVLVLFLILLLMGYFR